MASKTPKGSDFPLMGESLVENVLNLSGKSSPYTKSAPKKTMGRGASPTGKMASRGRSAIREANGPKCTIVTTLYKQNAAEASSQLRNTHLLPKAMVRPDRVGSAGTFWQKREYGQKLQ